MGRTASTHTPFLLLLEKAACVPQCKEGRRPFNHFLSKSKFLPETDKAYLGRARLKSWKRTTMLKILNIVLLHQCRKPTKEGKQTVALVYVAHM